MVKISSFGDYIKKKRQSKNLSIREAAKRSGISHPYLSQLENGKRDIPTIEVITKLSTGLNTDLSLLLKRAGYTDKKEEEIRKNVYKTIKKIRTTAPDKYDLNEIMKYVHTGTNFVYDGNENSHYESLTIGAMAVMVSRFFSEKKPPLSHDAASDIGDDLIESLEILLKRM